jgi:hypothetical protein
MTFQRFDRMSDLLRFLGAALLIRTENLLCPQCFFSHVTRHQSDLVLPHSHGKNGCANLDGVQLYSLPDGKSPFRPADSARICSINSWSYLPATCLSLSG